MAPSPVTDDAQLRIDFDEITAEVGTLVPGAANLGTATVRTEVVTSEGGRLRLAQGATGAGGRFPAHLGEDASPAAALLIWSDDGALTPGNADFTFGASFRLDAVSEGGDADNGDNLVQRGLFVDKTQFKLQIDHGVPSCRIAGSAGEVVVVLDEPVRRDTWYTVRCTRRAPEVRLELREIGGSTPATVVSVQADVGTLRFGRRTPVAVGAKVLAGGVVPRTATDQFNGVVDDVVVEMFG